MKKLYLFFISLLCVNLLLSAEYNGVNIDGDTYNCTAYSYSTGKYYYLDVEFDGDEVILYFPKGGKIRLTLDNEEIEDPSNISAYDYKKRTYWDLDVDIEEGE